MPGRAAETWEWGTPGVTLQGCTEGRGAGRWVGAGGGAVPAMYASARGPFESGL
jgi:hypothetical protein